MPSIEKMEKTAVDLSRQAEVYLAEGRLNEAVAACESALKIDPNLAVACQTLGKVMQVRGEIEQAKQSMKQHWIAIRICRKFMLISAVCMLTGNSGKRRSQIVKRQFP